MSYTIVIKFPKLGVAGSNPVCRSTSKTLKIRRLQIKEVISNRLFILYLSLRIGLLGAQ